MEIAVEHFAKDLSVPQLSKKTGRSISAIGLLIDRLLTDPDLRREVFVEVKKISYKPRKRKTYISELNIKTKFSKSNDPRSFTQILNGRKPYTD